MPSEFQLISQYFHRPRVDESVVLGIGDDAALLQVPHNEVLVATTDTFIVGRHCPENTSFYAIGHKAAAVNLSDLAAMGATPRWLLVAISLPNNNEDMIAELSNGLFALANQHAVSIVGGDTTKGPLSITITALGSVPTAQALTRTGAQVSDGIYVSGTIGDAGLGLQVALAKNTTLTAEHAHYCQSRLDFPQPRMHLGLALRGLASACIDISDGLAQDLAHILQASQVGAELHLEQLPLSVALQSLTKEQAWSLALNSGDDYELCFTLSDENFAKLPALEIAITRIGTITEAQSLRCYYQQQPQALTINGYQHF